MFRPCCQINLSHIALDGNMVQEVPREMVVSHILCNHATPLCQSYMIICVCTFTAVGAALLRDPYRSPQDPGAVCIYAANCVFRSKLQPC